MVRSVTFAPTPQMVLDVTRAAGARHWGGRERLRWTLAGTMLALLAFFLVAQYDWRVWGLYILRWQEIAGFAFAGAAAGWALGRGRGTIAPTDPQLRERTVTVDDDGLQVTSRHIRVALDWAAIETITVTQDAILFVTTWKEVHFVPRDAFAAALEADAFLDAARAAWSRRRTMDGAAEETTS